MANQSQTSITIGNVVKQARIKYEELMQSDYIAIETRIDGVHSRGQSKEADSIYSTQDKNSKLMTCLLDIDVHRGSLVEMKSDENDEDFSVKGIVTSIPNTTPVDKYFTVLFFNTEITRKRKGYQYNSDGDVVSDDAEYIENIPCYIERVGMRERQVNVGIERNSVNKLIAHKSWDIKKDDVLYVGDNSYRITDIEELEEDMLTAYMTFYREK